ncbi:phage tail assembly chaperone [Pseudomonas sp. Irchel 3H9]|uniref:phage tail assembly chaperone n=1 Tax=Pseudomonas sp. Irchel 3H9 TaxID=2009043 RepID=UPI0021143270|nr:phage tail assembly chaperone [Pseudomonas sp. Irchel 3H9]
MKIFYSAKQNTFFNEVFHGTRAIQVFDPEWIRPTLPVPDPEWIPPNISAPNPAWFEVIEVEGEESEAQTEPETILVPDPDAVHPMIEVPDEQASPPLITVPNPACLLPPESELVEVLQGEHDEIFRVLALGGSVLAPEENGRPTTIPAPGPTVEELKARERAIRDRVLLLTDPLISRHRDEVEAERPTTLTAEQYKQLQGYRQDLREWPESVLFPALEHRPEQPAWLADQLG